MPTVWIRDTPFNRSRFHRVKDCRQLVKKHQTSEGYPLIEIDLSEVTTRPCRTCYPTAPRILVRHPVCRICHTQYACEHNGGVLVTTRGGARRYVWPDNNQMPYYRTSA